MSPTAFWYVEALSPAEIAGLFGGLAARGLALENPGSGDVSMLDGEGERLPAGAEELRAAVERVLAAPGEGARVHFQLWLSDAVDVFCTFTDLGEGVVQQAYGLSGMDVEEKDRVVRALWGELLPLAGKTRAWLLDLEGDAYDLCDELDRPALLGEIDACYGWDLSFVRVPGEAADAEPGFSVRWAPTLAGLAKGELP